MMSASQTVSTMMWHLLVEQGKNGQKELASSLQSFCTIATSHRRTELWWSSHLLNSSVLNSIPCQFEVMCLLEEHMRSSHTVADSFECQHGLVHLKTL